MPMSEPRPKPPAWPWLFAALTILAAALMLYWFDPARTSFYPVCLFHQATGWQCPGCGGLRAVHQLLHGHIAEAFRLNALFVLSLPLLGWAVACMARARLRGEHLSFTPRPRWILTAAVLIVGFGIGRNLC